MKKLAFCFLILFLFVVSVYSQKQPVTGVVLVDYKSDNSSKYDKIDETAFKVLIEEKLKKTGKVRFDHFPAKLQFIAAILQITHKNEVIGYAASFVITEGIFVKNNPVLVFLDAGIIETANTETLIDLLVEQFLSQINKERI